MNRPLRFGIIGCGGIAPWHARGVLLHPEAEIVALCDVYEESALKLAEQYPASIYVDYRKMLDEANLDAVSICTPGGTHCPIVVAAAERGVHVLCEKPIEVNKPALDTMLGACRQHGVKFGGVFQLRTTPLWQTVRRIVQSGQLGKIVLADAYLKFYRTPDYYKSSSWRGTYALDGGACLINQGIHCIDQLLWCAGPVKSLFAYADHLVHNIEAEDTAVVALKFQAGHFGVLEGATSVYPGLKHRVEFHGEVGTLRVEGHRIVHLESALIDKEETERIIAEAVTAPNESQSDPFALGADNHVAQVRDFIDAVLEDRDPMCPGEEARKAVDLILSVYESVRSGKAVDL